MLPKADDVHCSARIERLRVERREDHDRTQIPERDRVYREAFAEHPNDPACLRFAYGFAKFLQCKKLHLKPHDLLAGFAYRYTYNTTLPVLMDDDYDPQYRPEYDVDNVREAKEAQQLAGVSDTSHEGQILEMFPRAIKSWLFKHWESGHILPGYHRVLEKGFGGLAKEGEKALATADNEHKPYIQAMLICNNAAIGYINRYAVLCADMAEKTSDPEQHSHLLKLASGCRKIADGVPQSFLEAVQLIWFIHEMMFIENDPASISLGRLDRTLYPFYKKDVDAGLLTYDEASDYIDALWIKFSANLHAYQNVTIGGIDPVSGDYTANDVTYIMLQSTRRLRFDQPLISLRYSDNMPDKMWAECLALVKTGTGFPAFFNDAACIKAKEDMGISKIDAKNYALIGCVEMGTPGKEYAKTEVLRINWTMILELMLNGGKTLLTDEPFSLHENRNLDTISNFEDFYDWYKSEMVYFGKLGMDAVNLLDPAVMQYYPTPYISCTMEQCYEKGLDVTGGGTVYNNTGVNICGMANAIDSLAAIRKVVFEDKSVTLKELAKAVKADFVGYEELQHVLINHCPKYGNDDECVDNIMSDLVATFSKVVKDYRNPRGGKFQLGLYSVEDHSKMGLRTGASPDGRKARASLANAISPVQGRDIVGPTAVINSLLKTDLSAATNGMVLDLKFNPSFLDSPRHTGALRALIDTYFKNGGMEIQFNVVDRATLVDAQLHPEQHQDLVVRVSGFSAYFVTLMKTTQDEIIARTEYAVM